MLAAIPDQTLLDLQQGDVRRAPDQPHEVVVMGFDAARAAIASQQPRRQFSRRFELLDPAHGARDADFETLCRRIARQPAETTASTTRLRRSSESAMPAASLPRRES